ncbi:hypothetical protein GCK72_017057 [Caenorhabditis remanei]|nr:hypothetical protein GCK72_017057 [Caenorhabditis remanei]KAF1750507.1 hypothetical protein GCK72_017057 [Caenorhabditis remanei]
MFYGSESSSSSSSSDDDTFVPEMRPTDLLSLAMSKRRALFSQKERNMRCENDQQQVEEPAVKKTKTSNFMDPFGLEDFFRDIHSRPHKATSTNTLTSTS